MAPPAGLLANAAAVMWTWWLPGRSDEDAGNYDRSPNASPPTALRTAQQGAVRGTAVATTGRSCHAGSTRSAPEAHVPEVGVRSPVTLRNVSIILKNLQERSAEVWNSDRSRHALDWLATQLKRGLQPSKSRSLPHPNVFWAALLGSLPLVIVSALFMSGNADKAWPPLATFGTALGATIIAIATLMRHFAQTEADRQRRIVETFSKAVEQLGSDKLEVRVGAIFALERLSRESSHDYWTVMEVLTAFVRDRMRHTTIMARLSERAYFLWLQAGRPEGRSEEFWREAVRLERLEQTPTDIAAILTVIGRRSVENRRREEYQAWRFDLSGTYLRLGSFSGFCLKGADLSQTHFEQADLNEVDLEEAYLWKAHLEGAFLFGAHLEEAFLLDAHLEGAHLGNAHLEGANLDGAHLEGANLVNAHLEGANLSEAHLEGASLGGAHLEGASLGGAHLEGAVGLTDDQLIESFGDWETTIPEGTTRPKTWPSLKLPRSIRGGTAIAGPPAV